uniref:hypothetical protein n=1 Tax=Thaumasiovibrio occultus TaxID=1891184 RepID=UPI00131E3D6F|nr:hypothetical protein [Thaumasiovibrio occultus]
MLRVDSRYTHYAGEDKELTHELAGLFTGKVQLPLPGQLPVRMIPGSGDAPKQPNKNGDLHNCVGSQLIFSERAVDALSLENYGKLFPVYLVDRNETFYWFWSTVVIDCLNHDETIWVSRLSKLVDKPSFYEDRLEDALIFTLPHDQNLQQHYFVSERFKEIVVKAKLKGIALYTSERESDPWVS